MMNRETVDKNIKATLYPSSDKEVRIRDKIKKKFFQRLVTHHWEGIEVEKYWNTIKEKV